MCCTLGTEQAKLTVLSQSFEVFREHLWLRRKIKLVLDNSPVLEFANVVPRILRVLPSHKVGSKLLRKTVLME